MSDDLIYSDWIDHDGSGCPTSIIASMREAGWTRINREFLTPGRTKTPAEQAQPDCWDKSHPGWTWRKRYILWGDMVASDPQYARIVRYRFARPKPDAQERSEQFELLEAIAAGRLDPVAEPVKATEPSSIHARAPLHVNATGGA